MRLCVCVCVGGGGGGGGGSVWEIDAHVSWSGLPSRENSAAPSLAALILQDPAGEEGGVSPSPGEVPAGAGATDPDVRQAEASQSWQAGRTEGHPREDGD